MAIGIRKLEQLCQQLRPGILDQQQCCLTRMNQGNAVFSAGTIVTQGQPLFGALECRCSSANFQYSFDHWSQPASKIRTAH